MFADIARIFVKGGDVAMAPYPLEEKNLYPMGGLMVAMVAMVVTL